MKTRTLLCIVAVIWAACIGQVLTGCGTTQTTPQASHSATAIAYLSFADVLTVTRAAYAAELDQYNLGKVSERDQADIDKAWNAFRAAYSIALEAAQMDKTQITPQNVKKLSDDLLTLIGAL